MAVYRHDERGLVIDLTPPKLVGAKVPEGITHLVTQCCAKEMKLRPSFQLVAERLRKVRCVCGGGGWLPAASLT